MATPSSSEPTSSSGGGSGRRRAGLARPRVLAVAFAVSTVLHLVVIALYPRLFQRAFVDPTPFVLPVSSDAAGGMEVIQVVEVASDEPEAPPDPDEVEEAEVAPPEIEGPRIDDEAGRGGLVDPGPTAAERLRPSLEDERLWGPVDPALTELTLEQRLELEMAGRLEEWRDSVNAAAEAERAMTDWTFSDGEGGRWGVSPGRIHLGDFSLPLPFGFGVNPGRREEAAYRAWELQELRRQQAEGQVRGSWRERAEAIRERRDRERREARPDTAGVWRDD